MTQLDRHGQDDEGFEGDLTEHERGEVERRTVVRAAVTHATVRKQGQDELDRSTASLAWSGLAAGLVMGFSMAAQGLLKARLPEAEWSLLITKLGYPVGFLIVVLGRKQLFTENTLTAIVPLLARRDGHTLANVLRLLGVVLAANIAGAHLFALFAAQAPVFDEPTRRAIAEIGHHAVSGGFGATFAKGILGGWLIALIPWLSPAAGGSRIWVIVILTYVVGIGQFSHIVAGSVDVLYNVMAGDESWVRYLSHFFLPTLLGNTLGGMLLVAAINHGQVASE